MLNISKQLLKVLALTIATQGILKTNLYLGFRLDHKYELGMGLHQFVLGQNTNTIRKHMKSHEEKHQVIVEGERELSLADAAFLTAPYGISLLGILPMARSAHLRLGLLVSTLLGPYHPTNLGLYNFSKEMGIIKLTWSNTHLRTVPSDARTPP